jgi:hypothetical protein
LPIKEIERQQEIFQELAQKISNSCKFDVEQPASSIARRVARLICEVMEQKRRTQDAGAISDCT